MLSRGDIVWVRDTLDPQGQHSKTRPGVLMQRDCSRESLFVVFITGEYAVPLPPTQVRMHWQRGGHPRTGLYKDCVAVCSWYEAVPQDRIESKLGECPESTMLAIVTGLRFLKEQKEKNAEGSS